VLTNALDCAGRFDALAAAQWLREQGAEWPAGFMQRLRRGAVLKWAIAEGCLS
jgi:hypothetical protein